MGKLRQRLEKAVDNQQLAAIMFNKQEFSVKSKSLSLSTARDCENVARQLHVGVGTSKRVARSDGEGPPILLLKRKRILRHSNVGKISTRNYIMRSLVGGLVLVILVISLTVFASQLLERQSNTGGSESEATFTTRTNSRITLTKRDLESAQSEIGTGERHQPPQESGWYDSIVSPFAGMFGLEEVNPDDELTILIDSKELKRVKKGYVNRAKPKVQNDEVELPIKKSTIQSVIASRRRHTFTEGAQLAEGAVTQVNLNGLVAGGGIKQQQVNNNNNNNRESFNVAPISDEVVALGSSVYIKNNNESSYNVANIDKIRGIDLDFSEMGAEDDAIEGTNSRNQSNEQLLQRDQRQNKEQPQQQQLLNQQQQQQHENLRFNRDFKCNKNKYDRLIAQKISLNEISSPVVTSSGRFDNPFSTWIQPSVVDAIKFMLLESDESNVPKDQEELDRELPMEKPDFSIKEGDEHEFKVTWIGHSTLVIQIDGLNILTDPVFSSRASPTQFFGPKRIREPACKIKDLPPIDAVIISHNHYDHLDANSVKQLNDRFGSDCKWIVPLGLGEFMRAMSVENYVELDWWQKDCFGVDAISSRRSSVSLSSSSLLASNETNSTHSETAVTSHVMSRSLATTNESSNNLNESSSPKNRQQALRQRKPELSIYLTPSQHWSRRGVNDVNKSLWGSYTIVSANDSTFFFGGDTGYCTAFKEVAKVFGPITGAAIPIGAYKPRWFLKTSHVDPHEAVQIHRDLKSSKSMAIHHSTFILSNEHYKEPSETLNEIMRDLKTSGSVMEPFVAFNHGQSGMFRKISRLPKL